MNKDNKDEILTSKNVAKFLKISEKEVIELAQKGALPRGKLGDTWRFNRREIENWANRRLTPRLSNNHIKNISLDSILTRNRIIFIRETKKEAALNSVIDLFLSVNEIENRQEIADSIFKREQLMSTGIGLSIAVPHARLNSINDIYMAIGICENDIEDYESLDNNPVRIIVMILAGRNQHTQYIQTLSRISVLLKEQETRNRILQSKSIDEIYGTLTGEIEE